MQHEPQQVQIKLQHRTKIIQQTRHTPSPQHLSQLIKHLSVQSPHPSQQFIQHLLSTFSFLFCFSFEFGSLISELYSSGGCFSSTICEVIITGGTYNWLSFIFESGFDWGGGLFKSWLSGFGIFGSLYILFRFWGCEKGKCSELF